MAAPILLAGALHLKAQTPVVLEHGDVTCHAYDKVTHSCASITEITFMDEKTAILSGRSKQAFDTTNVDLEVKMEHVRVGERFCLSEKPWIVKTIPRNDPGMAEFRSALVETGKRYNAANACTTIRTCGDQYVSLTASDGKIIKEMSGVFQLFKASDNKTASLRLRKISNEAEAKQALYIPSEYTR